MQNGLSWIDSKAPELSALSKEIWNFAEVGLREEKSAAALTAFLEKEGFSVQKGVAHMPTAFVASYGSGKPIIGFLGEYDSLAGLSQKTIPTREEVLPGGPGHGCGHNLLYEELHPDAKDGPVLDLKLPNGQVLCGFEPHWTYADIGAVKP